VLGGLPARPLDDLAGAAWTFAPLAPPPQLREAGFDPLPDLPARLRSIVDAYGLTDRTTILLALRRPMLHDPEPLRWLEHVCPDLACALQPD
jgi:hypothetical protein